jgi:peptide/nickel transport system permease protein
MSTVSSSPDIAGGWRRALKSIRSRLPWIVWISLAWLALVVFVSIFGEWVAPFGFNKQNLLHRLEAPFWMGGPHGYLLGTDHLGRDVYSRLIYGMRTSLIIALVGSIIGAVIGTVMGMIAAHFRGFVDDVVMTLVDFQASMPFLIIALAVLAFFGNNFLLFLAVVGLNGWEVYARLTRGQVISVGARGYAMGIRLLGAKPVRIYLRHILPNIASVLLVQLTLSFPETILLETSLSFLGLGVQPPNTSLGLALGEGRTYLTSAWWIGISAGVSIFLTTLAMSLVGDWARDYLDPRLR